MATTEVAYSPTVQAAINDPEGARRFLTVYGELTGWPAGGLKPIPCGSGQLAWINAVIKFPPLWLGQAIEQIEKAERTAVRYKGPASGTLQSQAKGPEETMAVLQPTTSTSLEPGFYRMTITEIEEKTATFDNKVVHQFMLQFVGLDGDGEPTDQEIRGYCTQAWHPKSKLASWAKAILGRKCPGEADPFDTDLLLRKKCDVEVVAYRKTDGSEGAKVGTLYPYKSMTKVEDSDD